jgi:hypothetical protein
VLGLNSHFAHAFLHGFCGIDNLKKSKTFLQVFEMLRALNLLKKSFLFGT